MPLISIVYVSIATKRMSDTELLTLLEKARINNRINAVTGLLLYRDGFFIQALEGLENIIVPLFASIKKDTLHYNVFQIYKKSITHRNFVKWAMGFESPNIDNLKNTAGFSDFIQTQQSIELSTPFKNEVENLLHNFLIKHK